MTLPTYSSENAAEKQLLTYHLSPPWTYAVQRTTCCTVRKDKRILAALSASHPSMAHYPLTVRETRSTTGSGVHMKRL